MLDRKLQPNFVYLQISIMLAGLFLILAWLVIMGWFFDWLVIILSLLFVFVATRQLFKYKKYLLVAPVVLLFIFSLFSGFMHHEYPLGRDDAGYITAAVKLAETNQLVFEDFFARPFHPFRDIDGNQDLFTSQFVPGYNVYLATYYSFFGETGIFWSNFLLIFLTGLAIFNIGLLLSNKRLGWTGLLLWLSFYTSWWFFRRTNSENLFMFLFWLMSWLFISGLKFKDLRRLLWGLIPASLLLLVRGEGIFFTLFYLLGVFFTLFKYYSQCWHKQKDKVYTYLLILPVLSFGFFAVYTKKFGGSYIFQHLYDFRRTIWQNFLSQGNIGWIFLLVLIFGLLIIYWFKKNKPQIPVIQYIVGAVLILVLTGKLYLDYYFFHDPGFSLAFALFRNYFVITILASYGLFVPLILITMGLFSQKLKCSRYLIWLIFLVSPSFIFLFDPFIALDQPWFLRRFFPIFLPWMWLMTAFWVEKIKFPRLYRNLIIILVIGFNLALAGPVIFHKDNYGANQQITSLAEKLKSLPGNSKIFIMSPGWSWQQWAYHLHFLKGIDILPNLDGIKPEELEAKIANYDQVYVISQAKFNVISSPYKEPVELDSSDPDYVPVPLWADDKLEPVDYFRLEYSVLNKTCPLTAYIFSQGEDIAPEKFARKCFQKIVPTDIDYQVIDLYIYKLDQTSNN